MLNNIFFQSSLPRSGSTFLQNLLSQNKDIFASGTDGCLELLFGARANYSNSLEFKAQNKELVKDAFLSFCKNGLEGYCSSLIKNTEATNVILKSRGWGVYRGFLESFYPNPKIICMVRDLRSIVASYEKIYRKNQHQNDIIRDDLSARGTTVPKRVDEWVSPINTIGRSIERLYEIKLQGYDNKILFVKYEDLVLFPEQEMQRIYDYLELPYFEHDFDNVKQTIIEDDSVYGLTNDLHTIRTKLQALPIDYKEILGKDVCIWIYNTFKWYFDMFNYRS